MNREQMVAPFAEEELHTFQGRGGKTMTYVEDETVMDRLDAGYGPGNWQVLVEPISDQVVKVRMGVRENGEWAWYEDFGYPNREGGESLKEAVSDGIRRCGRYVGIARDLYRRTSDIPGGYQNAPSGRLPEPMDHQVGPPDANGATEHLLGVQSFQGTVKLGTADAYKLEVRELEGGPAFGFRLEMADDKAIPQVLVQGDPATVAIAGSGGDPASMKDHWVRVKGSLFAVRAQGRRSFNRLRVSEIQTREWAYPPLPASEARPPSEAGHNDGDRNVTGHTSPPGGPTPESPVGPSSRAPVEEAGASVDTAEAPLPEEAGVAGGTDEPPAATLCRAVGSDFGTVCGLPKGHGNKHKEMASDGRVLASW